MPVMLLLALDTTSEMGGVAIFRDAECLASVHNRDEASQYSVSLFEMVGQALEQARVMQKEIDLYAAANGPGSFTGIRVGLAAAKAWGKAFGRPVRGVSILEAMVGKARATAGWAHPLMDARRGEFFLGSFRQTGASHPAASAARIHDYEPADEGWIFKPEALRAFLEERLLSGGSAACIVRAHDRAAAGLRTALPAALDWHAVEGDLLEAIAALARMEELAGLPCPAAKLDACYIRRPDAEVKLEAGGSGQGR